jgi:hypothetical protein
LSLPRSDVVDPRARAGALEGEGHETAEVGVAVSDHSLLRFQDADQLWLTRAECAMPPWPIYRPEHGNLRILNAFLGEPLMASR